MFPVEGGETSPHRFQLQPVSVAGQKLLFFLPRRYSSGSKWVAVHRPSLPVVQSKKTNLQEDSKRSRGEVMIVGVEKREWGLEICWGQNCQSLMLGPMWDGSEGGGQAEKVYQVSGLASLIAYLRELGVLCPAFLLCGNR